MRISAQIGKQRIRLLVRLCFLLCAKSPHSKMQLRLKTVLRDGFLHLIVFLFSSPRSLTLDVRLYAFGSRTGILRSCSHAVAALAGAGGFWTARDRRHRPENKNGTISSPPLLFALFRCPAQQIAIKVENRPSGRFSSFDRIFVFLSPFSHSRRTKVRLRIENGNSALDRGSPKRTK